MKKVLTLVTGSESTRVSLHNQIKEYLPSELTINSFSLELNRINEITCDVLLLSSEHIKTQLDILGIRYDGCEIIIAKRTINFDNIDLIVSIPTGTEVLLVNDSEISTLESIDILKKLGIDYLNYVPYYPGFKGVLDKISICITIGEIDRVPSFVDKVYDIGTRIIDFQTISDVLIKTGYLLSNATSFSNKYIEKIISMAKKFTISANNILAENKKSDDIIKKGFYAKYTFDDILGYSTKIKNVVELAKKFSNSNLTILIEGDSGTGKEVFANAIHNDSNRKGMPFVAINCSSLSDTLVESELFGYEKGSFTGANKDGKIGFFELADKGTIFLDEIGDISLKMQARLLRVLQEKEIIRVGGHCVKVVDVRIIAATNKNLLDMVKINEFRADLYYRLKVGYLNIPPLRDRKEDIPLLCKNFLNKDSNFTVKMDSEVMQEMIKYNWYGNIRELRNSIMYMIAVCDGSFITMKDFPPDSFFQEDSEDNGNSKDLNVSILEIIQDYNLRQEVISRKKIASILNNVSEYKVRKCLDELEKAGHISVLRGRCGIVVKKTPQI